MAEKLQGIFCPNMVPYNTDGSMNEDELRRIFDYLIERGISGLYPNGSTGEFVRLSYEERRRVIEIAIERTSRAGRDVPVLAGAAEAHVDLTIDTMNYYADLGCRAGALIAPSYFKLSQDSIKHYFTEIADRSRLPLVLYNIPQFSNEISVATIVELAPHTNIVGIKDSQRDLPRFMNTIAKVRPLRPDFTFLIGCEEILLASLLMGGDGGTIATSGVVPEVIMKLYNLFKQGRIDDATKIQFQMLELIEVMLLGADFPEGFRAGMSVRGFNMGHGRQHQSPAAQKNIERITNVVQCMISNHGLVNPPATGCPVPPATSSAIDEAAVREIVARVVRQLKV
jgi:4-hydroxy-tetrahydrodipicolinate synthase